MTRPKYEQRIVDFLRQTAEKTGQSPDEAEKAYDDAKKSVKGELKKLGKDLKDEIKTAKTELQKGLDKGTKKPPTQGATQTSYTVNTGLTDGTPPPMQFLVHAAAGMQALCGNQETGILENPKAPKVNCGSCQRLLAESERRRPRLGALDHKMREAAEAMLRVSIEDEKWLRLKAIIETGLDSEGSEVREERYRMNLGYDIVDTIAGTAKTQPTAQQYIDTHSRVIKVLEGWKLVPKP